MIPTPENIDEVARARLGAIRARARELGDHESDDARLLSIVTARAEYYATRPHHPAATAQAAVSWAITDMHTIDVPLLAEGEAIS
jgi:hypothetical protein